MDGDVLLAQAVLTLHVGVILFNIFGLIAVPLGAVLHWDFVHLFWWRALHLASLVVVAIQAMLGEACFLTYWQSDLLRAAGQSGSEEPLIQRTIEGLIFWPLPLWVFAAGYVAVLIYTIALWKLVPPRRTRNAGSHGRTEAMG
jgi:hypothetical protein